jgi:hypothetical protein
MAGELIVFGNFKGNFFTNQIIALNKNEVKSKSSKKCPKGKVLNPKTGRYILIKK